MNELQTTEYTQDRLQALAKQILEEAAKQGASSAEVDIGINKGFSVTARKGDVESVEYHQDKNVDITVYFGHRSGSASLSDLRYQAICDAVKAACNIARFTDEDPYSGLADINELAFNYPQIELAFPWDITVEEAIAKMRDCEAEALVLDKKISSEGSSLTTMQAGSVYANSLGFIGSYPLTRHEISCVLVAKENDEMQRDYSYTVACDPLQLNTIDKLAKEAVEKTVRRLGARKIPTQRVPVIFIAEEARSFLGTFLAAISGGNIYRKTSFLVDHLGKMVFPSYITLQERPHLNKALGSAPFDNDGVITRDNIFIENGILKLYLLGTYSARKLGLKSTGNAGGAHNLFVSTGKKDLAGLLKTMDKGLLVTELMGHGTNLLTGDYSQGAVGFWVENGTIQYPVQEITIASNLKDMYQQIIEIGNDVDTRGKVRTGSILIENMMIAGH